MTQHFPIFGKAVHARFKSISDGELYEVGATDLFESYLQGFPEGTNPIFRKRTEHDCSCCKHFIPAAGP